MGTGGRVAGGPFVKLLTNRFDWLVSCSFLLLARNKHARRSDSD